MMPQKQAVRFQEMEGSDGVDFDAFTGAIFGDEEGRFGIFEFAPGNVGNGRFATMGKSLFVEIRGVVCDPEGDCCVAEEGVDPELRRVTIVLREFSGEAVEAVVPVDCKGEDGVE